MEWIIKTSERERERELVRAYTCVCAGVLACVYKRVCVLGVYIVIC